MKTDIVKEFNAMREIGLQVPPHRSTTMEKKTLLALILPNLCGLSDTKVVVNVKEYAVWLEDATGATFKITIEKVEQ